MGNIPGQAVAFMTLFLQLLGMTDFWASALVALGMFAHALGGQAGGFLGDAAARRFPRYGRIVVCQVSVAAGAPHLQGLSPGNMHSTKLAGARLTPCGFAAGDTHQAVLWPAVFIVACRVCGGSCLADIACPVTLGMFADASPSRRPRAELRGSCACELHIIK